MGRPEVLDCPKGHGPKHRTPSGRLRCSQCQADAQRRCVTKDPERFRKTRRDSYHRRKDDPDVKRKKRARAMRRYGEAQLALLQLKAEHGYRCTRCGNTFEHCPAALEFHHVLGRKIAAVSSMRTSAPVHVILREAAKCELICANCHAADTWPESADELRAAAEARLASV